MTPNRSTRRQAKQPTGRKAAQERRRKAIARQLAKLACSYPLAVDTEHRHQPYPADLMPLSRAKVLTADPSTTENYNPIGTRGEQRHTPAICVDIEDEIDTCPPGEVDHESRLWTSSAGVVVNGAALRRANG
jgi:hypothetical protein